KRSSTPHPPPCSARLIAFGPSDGLVASTDLGRAVMGRLGALVLVFGHLSEEGTLALVNSAPKQGHHQGEDRCPLWSQSHRFCFVRIMSAFRVISEMPMRRISPPNESEGGGVVNPTMIDYLLLELFGARRRAGQKTKPGNCSASQKFCNHDGLLGRDGI